MALNYNSNCCPCPEAMLLAGVERSERYVVYEAGQDYDSQLLVDCDTAVCSSCDEPWGVVCSEGICTLAWEEP